MQHDPGAYASGGEIHFASENVPSQSDSRTLRAVWSDDYTGDPTPADWPQHFDPSTPYEWNPYRSALDARDRYEIVRLTSDFNSTSIGGAAYDPQPATVDRLMLSQLGSWIDLRGAWSEETLPAGLEVVEWRHKATMARDHYVRVEYAGYLFPFGHKAVLVKVTERKFFRAQPSGGSLPAISPTSSSTSISLCASR